MVKGEIEEINKVKKKTTKNLRLWLKLLEERKLL